MTHYPFCAACNRFHSADFSYCALKAQPIPVKWPTPAPTAAPAPGRIPDNDLSVCELHPGRKLMAHALLASVYPDGVEL